MRTTFLGGFVSDTTFLEVKFTAPCLANTTAVLQGFVGAYTALIDMLVTDLRILNDSLRLIAEAGADE
jgi:hypothetical protein